MKAKSNLLRSFLLAAGSSLLAISSASAQSGTWLGNGNAWNDTAAWSGGTIATGTANTANFTGVNITGDVSMALGANRTIGNITFTDATTSSNDLTLTGNTLTLDVSTGQPNVNITQADRNLTISSVLAGADGISKTGQGTLTLGGINTITGATVISGGGTLVLDYSTNDNRKLPNNSSLALSGGRIVLKGGTATENMTGGANFNGAFAGTFFVRDGGTAKINLNAFTIGATSVVSFSHDSMATTDRLNTIGILGSWFTVRDRWATNAGVGGAGGSAGAGAAADGDIVGYTGGATFTNALVTDNNTNADLSGALTLSGSKTVNTLRIVSTADNQVLNIGANLLSTSNLTANGTSTSGGILYAGGANGNYTIQGTTGALRQFNQNGQGQLINVYSGMLTVDAIVGSGSSPLIKTGEGTLDLKKDNAYGSLRVYQGVVRLSHNNSLENTSTVQNGAAIELSNGISIGAFASTITGTGISNGGALRSLATTTSSFAGAITIGTGGARINSDSTGTLTLSGGVVTAGNTVTFGGAGNTTVSTVAISGTGGLVKDGAGTTNLSFAHTYTGATIISEGTLRLGNTTVGGGTAGRLTATSAITNNANLTINRSDAFSQATDLGAGVAITGSGSFTQAGTGTTTLTASNSYSGSSTVSAGTLKLGANNVLPDVSNVTIGTATLDADTRTDTAGTLDVTGTSVINLGSGAALAFANSSAVTAGVWAGTLNITGTFVAGNDVDPGLGVNLGSIRFGTDNTALTATQLAAISVNGSGAGTYTLDAFGYLKSNFGPGPVDHFVISAISSPQTVGTPITGITITAEDSSNATATGFTGTVTFGGTGGFTGTSATFTAGVLSGVSVTPTVAGSNLTFTVDDGASHTGSTTITTIQTQYQSWAGGALFNQDANNDGVNNGMAFLLGATSPTAAVTSPTVTQNGGDLTLNFNCLPDAARGNATLRVEHSNDLGAWTATTGEVPDTTNAIPDNDVTFEVAAGPVGPPALNTVTATIDSAAAGGTGKLFGRLKAVETP